MVTYMKVRATGDLYGRTEAYAARRFPSRNAAVAVLIRRGLERGIDSLLAPAGDPSTGMVLMVPLSTDERSTLDAWAERLGWSLTDVIRSTLLRELRHAGA